jgi:hypothetical protein
MNSRISKAVSAIALAISLSAIGPTAMAKSKNQTTGSTKPSRGSISLSRAGIQSTINNRRPPVYGNVNNIDLWVGGVKSPGRVEYSNVIQSIGTKYTMVRRGR